MCELLIGLPDVQPHGVIDLVGEPMVVIIEQRMPRPRCSRCGSMAQVKERPHVSFADLPCFGRPVRLVWRKHRWECPTATCPVGSWTGEDPRIAAPRMGLTDRAGRWATEQVGRHGRSVSEVADDLAHLGVFTEVVDDVEARAMEMAAQVAQLPPLAASIAKQACDRIPEAGRDAALLIERLAYAALAKTDESQASSERWSS